MCVVTVHAEQHRLHALVMTAGVAGHNMVAAVLRVAAAGRGLLPA